MILPETAASLSGHASIIARRESMGEGAGKGLPPPQPAPGDNAVTSGM